MKNHSIYFLWVATLFLLGVFFAAPKLAQGAPAQTSTFLGKVYTGDGGLATKSYLDMPKGFVFGPDGALFIADTADNAIRKIDSKNILSTFSGSGEYGREDGSLLKSNWSEPEGITYDGKTTFYVADTGSSLIRKIKGGVVSTIPIAGLRRPNAVIVSGSSLYISDTGNGRVVKTSVNGGALTVLASGLASPLKMAISGNTLYVAELDKGNVLAINTANKTKTNLASGFTEPRAIALYSGYLYLTAGPSGMYNEIWRINLATKEKTMLARRIETELLNQTSDMLLGNWRGAKRLILLQSGGSSIYTTDLDGQDLQLIAGRHRYGDESGMATRALLGRPQEIVASADGTKLYIAYAQGNKIAEYNFLTDEVRVIAGHLMDNYREGIGEDARFSDVVSMAISPDGKILYLADRNSQRIRTLEIATGITHYLTGAGILNLINPLNPTGNIDVNTSNGYQEGGPCPDTYKLGVAGCTYFNRPTGLTLTKNGKTLYVADGSNDRIRKVDVATGKTSLIAGSGKKGMVNGIGNAASFNGPYTIALSANEKNLYVADKYNHAIRAIDLATKRVTTLAGTGKQGYREGLFTQAMFAIPEYIDLGPDGNLYVSEAGNFRVRKLDLARKLTSLVSGSGERGKRDGAGEISEWYSPKGIAFLLDKMFVADFKNDLIRVVDLAGQVQGAEAIPVSPAKIQFFAFDKAWRGGFSVSAGDVNGDDNIELIAGSSAGYAPKVKIFDLKGKLLSEFSAYADSLKTGIRLTSCDLNGDGLSEIITVPGKGAPPHVRIFDQNGHTTIPAFFALDGKFRGGVSLVCGDVTGDKKPDIVVSALEGSEPRVYIYSSTGKKLSDFLVYNKNFRSGVELGLADIDGNVIKEILTVPFTGSTHVQIYSGSGKLLSPGFKAFESNFLGGAKIIGGDIDGNGKDEIIVASGKERTNEVRIYNKRGILTKVIHPYIKGLRGGINIFAEDIDGDKKDELITIPASIGAPQLRVIDIL